MASRQTALPLAEPSTQTDQRARLRQIALYWPAPRGGHALAPKRGEDGWWRLCLESPGLEVVAAGGATSAACVADAVRLAEEALHRRVADLRERALRLAEQADEIERVLATHR